MEHEEWEGRMGERWVWRMCNIWEESTLQFGLGTMWSWGDPEDLQSLKEGLRLSQYSKSSTYEPSSWCGGGLVAKVLFNSCNPMDWSPPGSSVHGISQARILEWDAISFSRGSSQARDWTPLQADSLPSEPPGKPQWIILVFIYMYLFCFCLCQTFSSTVFKS